MCICGADGVHFGVRLEVASQCILVVIGANADGKSRGGRSVIRGLLELLAKLEGAVKNRTGPTFSFRKIGSGRLRFDFDEIVEWTKRGDENAD